MARSALALLALAVAACQRPPTAQLTVLFPAEAQEAVRFALDVPGLSIASRLEAKPEAALGAEGGLAVAVVLRSDCAECYRLERSGDRVTLSAAPGLGVQYGLAALLEAMGVRFYHPRKTHLPPSLKLPPDAPGFGLEVAPQLKVRALHLHTLHPIEPLYDFWVASAKNLADAEATLQWVVRNRGNQVQVVALDDLVNVPGALAPWRAHFAAITQAAHARGLKLGLGVQLFGSSNLQLAYDLIDGAPADPKAAIRERLRTLLDGVAVDNVNLSFGEFSATDADAFIARVNDVADVLGEVAPQAELFATIHVGDQPELRVTYQGKSQLYYFLVRYAKPKVIPWVHTVMYYNLFEDAGGAYFHQRFDEHRAFLLEKLKANERVAYFPESAYWVAFDINVPTWVTPLYLRSRFLDLQQLNAAADAQGSPRLSEHVLFSSGWEWGYWQTDALTLRMTHTLPQSWSAPLAELFAPYGEVGAAAAAVMREVGEAEHQALIGQRLAAYFAGRDQLIDAGRKLGIIGQPDRLQPEEVAVLDAPGRAAFQQSMLEPMGAFADALAAAQARFAAAAPDASDPFLGELSDCLEVSALRARFSQQVYGAALAYAAGDQAGAEQRLAQAEATLSSAKVVVARRRKVLHDDDALSILRNNKNPTFYQYGYLREADTLCFWNRERAAVRSLVLQTGDVVPGCVL